MHGFQNILLVAVASVASQQLNNATVSIGTTGTTGASAALKGPGQNSTTVINPLIAPAAAAAAASTILPPVGQVVSPATGAVVANTSIAAVNAGAIISGSTQNSSAAVQAVVAQGAATAQGPRVAAVAMDSQTNQPSQQDLVVKALKVLIKDVANLQAQQAQPATAAASLTKRQTGMSDSTDPDAINSASTSDDSSSDDTISNMATDTTDDASSTPSTPMASTATFTLGSTFANPNASQPAPGSGTYIIPLLTGPGLNSSSGLLPADSMNINSSLSGNSTSTSSTSFMRSKRQAKYNVANAGMDAFREALVLIANSTNSINATTNSSIMDDGHFHPMHMNGTHFNGTHHVNGSTSSGMTMVGGKLMNATSAANATDSAQQKKKTKTQSSGAMVTTQQSVAISGMLVVCAFMMFM